MRRNIRLTDTQAELLLDLLDAGYLHKVIPVALLGPDQRKAYFQLAQRNLLYGYSDKSTENALGENAVSALLTWEVYQPLERHDAFDDRLTLAYAHFFWERDVKVEQELTYDPLPPEDYALLGWRTHEEYPALDHGASCKRLYDLGLLEFEEDNAGLLFYRLAASQVGKPRPFVQRAAAKLTKAQQVIVNTLKAGGFISLQYGRATLIMPLPKTREDGVRAIIDPIRSDVFDRLQPMLKGRVQNPWEDSSPIIYQLIDGETEPLAFPSD